MKKTITLFVFLAGRQTAFAQNKYQDSLKTVLENTAKPIERFNLLNKIGEDYFVSGKLKALPETPYLL
jgi:hypothetical protein